MGALVITIKMAVVAMAVAIPMVMLLVHRWRVGSILLPSSSLVYVSLALPFAYLLSMIFAQDKFNALLSLNYNTDSVIMITLGILAMLTVILSGINKPKKHRLDIRKSIMCAILVITGIFAAQILSQLVLSSVPTWLSAISLVGSWIDVSILLALLVVMLLGGGALSAGMSIRKRVTKIVLVLLSMLTLSIFLNITYIFILLALITFVQLVSIISKSDGAIHKLSIVLPGIVFVVSGLFILDSTIINGRLVATLQGATGVSFVDIRPNWQGTITVAQGSISQANLNEKLFGPGVGSFADQWRIYKPVVVNSTRFWDTNFNYAVGFIPTTIITGGIVVFAAWLVFFFMLFRLLISARRSSFAYPVVFVWMVMLFNPIDYIVLLIAFILTGALVSDAIRDKLLPIFKYQLRGDNVNKYLLYVVLPLLMIMSISIIGTVTHRAIVNTYLLRASNAMLANNFNKAEQLLLNTKRLADIDVIEQGYTRVAFTELVTLLSNAETDGTDVDQGELQATLANVLSHARTAIEKNPKDPVNYITLGSISEQLMGLNIEGARESAMAAYEQAAILDPLNPSIPFALAKLSANDEDKTQYIKYLDRSLAIKSNYIPALYQYALLKLSNGDKETAAQILTTIIQLDNNNANALYYLSALYFEEGRIEEALILMNRVQLLNPKDENIAKIITEFKTALESNKTDGAAPDVVEVQQ
jgi:cytochrome c-type biogenesis protein CcmH/NrfG